MSATGWLKGARNAPSIWKWYLVLYLFMMLGQATILLKTPSETFNWEAHFKLAGETVSALAVVMLGYSLEIRWPKFWRIWLLPAIAHATYFYVLAAGFRPDVPVGAPIVQFLPYPAWVLVAFHLVIYGPALIAIFLCGFGTRQGTIRAFSRS